MFSECENLSEISIPDSFTIIDEFAFYGCSSLTKVSIPSSVTSIKKSAFEECLNLASIQIPSSMNEIGQYCFFKCHSLTQIVIPSQVTVLEDSTFRECSNLTQISLPNKLMKIGCHCFEGCISLMKISIPSSIKQIGCFAFKNCTALKEIEIPSFVTVIEPYTFFNCSSLNKISIPNTVVYIGDHSFQLCKSLENVIIPASVKTIDDGAFMECLSLKLFNIPNTVTHVGNKVYTTNENFRLKTNSFTADNQSRYKIDISRFEKYKYKYFNHGGCFFAVKEINTNKNFAQRVLPNMRLSEDKILNNIIDNELRLQMNTNHPAFIKFYGYSFQNVDDEYGLKIIYDTTEYKSVANILQEARMGLAPFEFGGTSRQIILIGVARAMKYLHDLKIYGVNIDPKNILIDEYFYPHLICSYTNVYNIDFYFNNTPLCYMSPEMIKNSEYGEKSDVYAFGMFMFEVVTEKLPDWEFRNYNNYQLKKEIVENNLRPKIDSYVYGPFKELIEKCWSPNPEERPTFKEIFRKLAFDENYRFECADGDEIYVYVEDITDE